MAVRLWADPTNRNLAPVKLWYTRKSVGSVSSVSFAASGLRNDPQARGQEGWLAPARLVRQARQRGQATLTPSTRAAQVPTVGAKAHRSFRSIAANHKTVRLAGKF